MKYLRGSTSCVEENSLKPKAKSLLTQKQKTLGTSTSQSKKKSFHFGITKARKNPRRALNQFPLKTLSKRNSSILRLTAVSFTYFTCNSSTSEFRKKKSV